jgi:hypothetical protein
MGSLNFGSFLDKLGEEVNNSPRRSRQDDDVDFEDLALPEDLDDPDDSDNLNEDFDDSDNFDEEPEPEPVRKPQPRRREPQELPEDNYDDQDEDNSIRIDEEFRDKAYDYAQGVVKVIRNNFKDKEERIVMLESVYKAVVRYLDDIGSPIVESTSTYTPRSVSNGSTASDSISAPSAPVIDRFNPDPTILEGQEVVLSRPTPMKLHEGDTYDPTLKLGIKVNAQGQQEVDLSRITNKDLHDMRTLMGIGTEQVNG